MSKMTQQRLKRRHHLEREALLEALVIGAMLADEEFRASVPVGCFQGGLRHVVENIHEPGKGLEALQRWLSGTVGVERKSGEKVLEACVRQLSKNAELVAMESNGSAWEATLIRFHEACERRRARSE